MRAAGAVLGLAMSPAPRACRGAAPPLPTPPPPAPPPPPWAEEGYASVIEMKVPVALAQAAVPPGFAVVESTKGSGVTKGSIFLAHYLTGTVAPYSELGFSVATVSAAGAEGQMEMVMFVDDPVALAGGRDLWGINKSLATFTYADDWRSVSVVAADGAPQLSATFAGVMPALPAVTVNATTLSVARDAARAGHVLRTEATQTYAVQVLLSKTVTVPPTSRLYPFTSQGATLGEAVHMSKGSFVMHAAEDISST